MHGAEIAILFAIVGCVCGAVCFECKGYRLPKSAAELKEQSARFFGVFVQLWTAP